MAKQTFTTGQVLTAAQQNSLQSNDFNQTVSVKTANYSLLAADKGTRIEFNTSGSVTCTVNSGQFDAGDTLIIQNRGAGTATITAGTATVNTSASLALAQYSAGTLYFVSDSAALFFGDAAGISASLIDAKGDLIVGTADNTVGRLAVGTNGYTLVADSAETTGLKWQAPAGGGKVLQVVSANNSTETSSSSSTFADTNLTATITPTSATSTILVLVNQTGLGKQTNDTQLHMRLLRGATVISNFERAAGYNAAATANWVGASSVAYVDSPATTSATTYKTQFASKGNNAVVYVQGSSAGTASMSTIVLMEIGA
jgi:hypothetical protein